MAYKLSGEFLEACDCYVVCPCWLGNDPDEAHCVGMFVWFINEGSVICEGKPVDVAGAAVAAMTTHEGDKSERRRTVLYIDARRTTHEDAAVQALSRAFRGELEGPLSTLQKTVFGTVTLTVGNATISTDHVAQGVVRIDSAEPAMVTVHGEDGVEVASSTSSTKALFGSSDRSVLIGTNLEKEVSDRITLRRGSAFKMNVPLLDIEVNVAERSAVTGTFSYEFAAGAQPAHAAAAGA